MTLQMATHFRKPVRTRGTPMPVLIGTVEVAIEAVFGLPNRVQERPHWRAAKEALYKAVYETDYWKTKIGPRVPDILEREANVVTRIVPTAKSTMR